MLNPDDDLSALVKQSQELSDRQQLSEAAFRVALRGLGIGPDQI